MQSPNIPSQYQFEENRSKDAQDRARKGIFNIIQRPYRCGNLTRFTHLQFQTTPPRYCYEMDKTSTFMFEILEPGGQLWANTAFEGSQCYSIGVPKFYSWVNVISVYVYNDLG